MAEVTHMSLFGIWIFCHDTEYFLPYQTFPWFKEAKVSDIFNLQTVSPRHLYWPKLDVDVDVDSLAHPEQYPLTATVRAA